MNQTLLLLSKLFLSAGVVLMMTRCDQYQVKNREATLPITGMTIKAPHQILKKDKTGLADDATGLKGLLEPRYLGVGKYVELVVTPTPAASAFGQGKKVTWTVADTSIAQVQVNPSGLVAGITGKGVGNTTVTITSAEDPAQTQSFPVNVIYKVDKIAFKGTPPPDTNPPSAVIEATITPANPHFKGIEWKSSDPNIATIYNATLNNGTPTSSGQLTGQATLINNALKVYGIVMAVAAGTIKVSLTSAQAEPKRQAFKDVKVIVEEGKPVITFPYCLVTGSGNYNTVELKTTGGQQNIDYKGTAKGSDNYLLIMQTLEIARGKTFELSREKSNKWSRTIIWIDWNRDLVFEKDERLKPIGGSGVNSPVKGSTKVTVPGDASVGTTTMRVVTGDAWTYADATGSGTTKMPDAPCGNAVGQMINSSIKDFTIKITE